MPTIPEFSEFTLADSRNSIHWGLSISPPDSNRVRDILSMDEFGCTELIDCFIVADIEFLGYLCGRDNRILPATRLPFDPDIYLRASTLCSLMGEAAIPLDHRLLLSTPLPRDWHIGVIQIGGIDLFQVQILGPNSLIGLLLLALLGPLLCSLILIDESLE